MDTVVDPEGLRTLSSTLAQILGAFLGMVVAALIFRAGFMRQDLAKMQAGFFQRWGAKLPTVAGFAHSIADAEDLELLQIARQALTVTLEDEEEIRLMEFGNRAIAKKFENIQQLARVMVWLLAMGVIAVLFCLFGILDPERFVGNQELLATYAAGLVLSIGWCLGLAGFALYHAVRGP